MTTKTFEVQITETLTEIIPVEAQSEAEAIQIVKTKYRNEDIILDDGNYSETNFEIYDN